MIYFFSDVGIKWYQGKMPDDYHQDAVVALGLAGAGAMGTMLAPSVETQCVSSILGIWHLAGMMMMGMFFLEHWKNIWLFGCLKSLDDWKNPCWIYPQADLWINVTKKIQTTKVLPS